MDFRASILFHTAQLLAAVVAGPAVLVAMPAPHPPRLAPLILTTKPKPKSEPEPEPDDQNL